MVSRRGLYFMDVVSGTLRRLGGAVQRHGASRWTWFAAGAGAALLLSVVSRQRFKRRRREEEKEAQNKVKEKEKKRGYVIFSAGVLSGLAAVGCYQLIRRYHSPNPDRVFSTVLPILRANQEVRSVFGSHLKTGLFRAYTYAGGVEASRKTLLSYKPRSLQLMFQVLGEGEGVVGMVSVDVRRRVPWGRALEFSSLALDLPSGERLVLKGKSSDVVFQGYTKLR